MLAERLFCALLIVATCQGSSLPQCVVDCAIQGKKMWNIDDFSTNLAVLGILRESTTGSNSEVMFDSTVTSAYLPIVRNVEDNSRWYNIYTGNEQKFTKWDQNEPKSDNSTCVLMNILGYWITDSCTIEDRLCLCVARNQPSFQNVGPMMNSGKTDLFEPSQKLLIARSNDDEEDDFLSGNFSCDAAVRWVGAVLTVVYMALGSCIFYFAYICRVQVRTEEDHKLNFGQVQQNVSTAMQRLRGSPSMLWLLK